MGDVMDTTGKRIKLNRKRAGLTQNQLADLVGISMMSIRRYENDNRIVTIGILQKIANALNIQVSDLIPPARAVSPDATTADTENCLGLPTGTLNNAPKAEEIEAQNKNDILDAMDMLNIPGQQEAVKRVKEMSDIPQYKKQSLTELWGFDKKDKK